MNSELLVLTVQGLRRKRRSSLLLLAVLALSFSFAVISLTVSGSIRQTNENYRYDTYGVWYGCIPDGRQEDPASLDRVDGVDKVGSTTVFGKVNSPTGSANIGIADENFLEMGRIDLQEGRFPEAETEIAMEADLLSALGYAYTLGQEIELPVQFTVLGSPCYIVQTYTLCGVIREYTNLWSASCNVCSALLTPRAAELLMAAAAESLNATQLTPDSPTTAYFFTVGSENREEALQAIRDYLRGRSLITNTAVLQSDRDAEYSAFYTGMILAVALLSVICIYGIQLRDQAQQYAIFRSIGITRRQLIVMLLYETLCLCIPAILLGVLVGICGTWALLRLVIYSGTVPIAVSIPWDMLAGMSGVWGIGVLLARIAVFTAAVRTPPVRRVRRHGKLPRRAMITALSALLCVVVYYIGLESLEPVLQYRYWDSTPDYVIYRSHRSESLGTKTVSGQDADRIASVPGIETVTGFSEVRVGLEYPGLADDALWQAKLRDENGDDKVYLMVVGDTGWENTVDLKQSGIDPDRFARGEEVLISFPTDLSGNVEYCGELYQRPSVAPGEALTLILPESGGHGSQTVKASVGGIHSFTTRMNDRLLAGINEPYTVICSEAFFQNLLNAMEPEATLGKFTAGQSYAYERVYAYADLNAGYLSTDAVLAEVCNANELFLRNNRETCAASQQEYLQTTLLLLIGGSCIVMMLLLILWNSISLEAERQRQEYGTLQAIGMSRRQMRRRITREALCRAGIGAVLGWLGYILVFLMRIPSEQANRLEEFGREMTRYEVLQSELYNLNYSGASIPLLLFLTLLGVSGTLAVSWLGKRRLLRGDLMKKLRNGER